MKKTICLLLAAVMLLALAACGGAKKQEDSAAEPTPAAEGEFKWLADGFFADESGNMLSITYMDDVDEPGWYVGCMLGDDPIEDSWGGMLPLVGQSLQGELPSEGSKDPLKVTLTETGAVGVRLEIEGGESYVFTPMDLPEPVATVTVNTDGFGQIAYAEGSGVTEFEDGYFSSCQFGIEEPGSYTFSAKTDEDGWGFIKWTLNGEDYTTDPIFTAEITEDADFVAVFESVDSDGQNPVMNFIGNYVCDRAHALVECIGDDGAQITIEWAGSAFDFARWTIIGTPDPDTMAMDYSACTKTIVTVDSEGKVTSEEQEYDNGTGSIRFGDDLSFIWHEDGADRDDMTFEWAPVAED